MEEIQNIKPRKYQEEIFETCREKNCLVVLPTGIGKTLVALMLATDRMKKFPESKIMFLAPTKPLAQQHLDYFKKHLPELYATLELFTGKTEAEKRKKLWQNADIIFSTPQCISNDVKNSMYDLKDVSLLIEDECHRCMKNYSYTYVASEYKKQARNPRILGLTASPGSDKARIKKIVDNLNIEAVEIRTRESEDVKEYLQELKFEVVKVDFPPEFDEIRVLLKKIFDKKTEELRSRKLLFMPPTKKYLLETQHKIMHSISMGNKHFNLLLGASACAQAIKLQHALELLETQTLSSFLSYIQDLFSQAEKKESKAVQNLVKQAEFNQAYIKSREIEARKIEHPKLARLKEIVEEELKQNPRIRAIIFAQYRDTLLTINKALNSIKNINARIFVGQAKKENEKGETTGLSQREQQEIIHDFSLGKINILCASQIGEEGLDIPEVNTVIFYEPVPSEIRKIQRAGRTARLMKGKLIMLVTKKTRDESYYWAAFQKEKKMKQAIEDIQKEFDEKEKIKQENNKQKKLFE
ncbi:DEAD/DEAH box helicase [Candidatus Pacearchaeota archaeon]|nr:DEAD/DEAH box helicase [Candidatus Pacearchaeota archaeon]